MYFDQTAFGRRLKEIRKERGFTQEQLADILNVSVSHLGNLELGKRGISIDLLMDMSNVLSVSIDFLLCGAASPPYQINHLLTQLTELLTQVEALSQNLPK